MSVAAQSAAEMTGASDQRTARLIDRAGWVLFALLLAVALVRSRLLTAPLYGDERHFLPSTVALAPFTPEKLAGFRELASPTFFIACSYVVHVLGANVAWLRLLVLASLLACVLVFRRAAREAAERAGAAPAFGALAWALLLTFPYLVGCGVYYYSDVPALLFAVLAVRDRLRGRTATALLYAALALHCRQYYAFIPAAMVAAEGWRWLRRRDGQALARAALWTLPIISFMPYVLFWGGPSPMRAIDPRLEALPAVQPWNAAFLLAACGLYLLPVSVYLGRRRWGALKIGCVVAALAFFAAFPPRPNLYYEIIGSPIRTLGVLDAALRALLGDGGALAALALGMASAAVLHYELLGRSGGGGGDLKWMLAAFWAMNLASHLAWEKYLLPVLPLLYLLALRHPSVRRAAGEGDEAIRPWSACIGGHGWRAAERARRAAQAAGRPHRSIMINARCLRLLPFVAPGGPVQIAAYLLRRLGLDGRCEAGAAQRAVSDWLRCEWLPAARELLLVPDAEGDRLRKMLDEHAAGRRDHGPALYEALAGRMRAGEPAEPPPMERIRECFRDLPAGRPLRRIAVLAPAGIGDTVRLTPGLRDLAEADPAASVTLYVDRAGGAGQVMAAAAPVDRIVPIPFRSRGPGKLVQLLRELRAEEPDELVSTWVSRLAGLAGGLSGVRERAGWVPRWSAAMRLGRLGWGRAVPYDPPCRGAGQYDVRAFRRLLGLSAPDRPVLFRFAEPIREGPAVREARRRLAALPRPVLAVAAAAKANIPQREYPLPMMAHALEMILAEGHAGSVVLLGGAAARGRMGPLREAAGARGLDLCGELALAETAALVRACDGALMVDGGLLHVALCTHLPVVALFGPTEVFPTDPRGPAGRYVALSAFDRCRCRCLPQRGIEAAPECSEAAACLAAVPPERVAGAVGELLRHAASAPLERTA